MINAIPDGCIFGRIFLEFSYEIGILFEFLGDSHTFFENGTNEKTRHNESSILSSDTIKNITHVFRS